MEIPTLTTEHLVLRPFRLDDLDAYAAMNPDVAARSLRFAHQVVGARGVASHILAGNAAAMRVAERLGARYAGDADVQHAGHAR